MHNKSATSVITPHPFSQVDGEKRAFGRMAVLVKYEVAIVFVVLGVVEVSSCPLGV